ncbi:TonB family protein [Thiogranum longum]|uniref:TonB family protein n=1 Tax=Thiogranum longum TaxID=1537524 RepID=A0A4R1HBD1_9GAMM|nr:TonB family protein [Thiogranum longum]TCK19274.1 TonB family protein [Thiogranum longum]
MDLRIAVFVTASTLAHSVLMLWPAADRTQQLTVGGEARALQVTLASLAGSTEHSIARAGNTQALAPANDLQRDSDRKKNILAPVPVAAKTVSPVAAKQGTDVSQFTGSTPQPLAENTTPHSDTTARQPASRQQMTTTQHSSTKLVSEYISAALRNRLAQHFEYPWLAQQRGWEGRVLLSLRVASNGSLTEWKIIQTSGYRTLDQSALKAVKRIEHLPQARRWLKNGSLEVRLPVQYKLLGS